MSRNKLLKGRGSISNPDCRYAEHAHAAFDDGWDNFTPLAKLATTVIMDTSRSVICYNQSPDLPFDRSINPYRGCEHGCSYCFARPSHAYLGYSPGLDFESKLIIKPQLETCLTTELSANSYRCRTIALGTNTDPYQPIEKKYRLTRKVLEILHQCRHPVCIVTKGALIERDIDLLADMAEHSLAEVMISISTLDKQLARHMEPRAAAPARRLQTIRTLVQAGIPTGVMVAPLIPQLTDTELEDILRQSSAMGICRAEFVMLRLPGEVSELFSEWLQTHYPLKVTHVLNTLRNIRAGKINDSTFGQRLRGQGAYASMLAQRFKLCCKRLGLNQHHHSLTCELFRPPRQGPYQLSLFDDIHE